MIGVSYAVAGLAIVSNLAVHTAMDVAYTMDHNKLTNQEKVKRIAFISMEALSIMLISYLAGTTLSFILYKAVFSSVVVNTILLTETAALTFLAYVRINISSF